jgi:hypothetical protein
MPSIACRQTNTFVCKLVTGQFLEDTMPVRERNDNRAGAKDEMSTTMAQAALAAETRAFGNKAAKLSLQTATTAFVHAKRQLETKTSKATKQEQE